MTKFVSKKGRIRKTTIKSGHEISVPPAWIIHRKISGAKENEDVELLYDSIIVIVPSGVKIDKKQLDKIVVKGKN